MPRRRIEGLTLTEQLELSIGRRTAELVAMWQRHGAKALRSEFGHKFDVPLSELGPPDGWTEADEQARNARRFAASQ